MPADDPSALPRESWNAGDVFAHRPSNEILVIDKPRDGERVMVAFFSIRDGSFHGWDYLTVAALGTDLFPFLGPGSRETEDREPASIIARWRDAYGCQQEEVLAAWTARHNVEDGVTLALAPDRVPAQKCGICADPFDWGKDRIVHNSGLVFSHADCAEYDAEVAAAHDRIEVGRDLP